MYNSHITYQHSTNSTTSISYEMKNAKKYFISYISKRVNGRPFVLPEEILYTVFEGIKYEK